MADSNPVQSGDKTLPLIIRRNNLYLSSKTTLLVSGSSKPASDGVINADKNGDIGGGGGCDVVEDEATEKSRIGKGDKKVWAFPPLLTILNRNGRPKFTLETVRKDGTLRISLVPNHFSEVVRTPKGGDRVSMELLETGTH